MEEILAHGAEQFSTFGLLGALDEKGYTESTFRA